MLKNIQLFSSFRSFRRSLTASPINPGKSQVLIVGGYNGSGFKGVQFIHNDQTEENSDPDTPIQYNDSKLSIENNLVDALHSVQLVRDSNRNIQKINWSRSSRTDKGVHANNILFSANLIVPGEYRGEKFFVDIPHLPKLINNSKVLDSNIKIFQTIRVPNSFDAQSITVWRHYHYILPIKFLQKNKDFNNNKKKIVERLNFFLNKYKGINSFHNFHRDATKRTETSIKDYEKLNFLINKLNLLDFQEGNNNQEFEEKNYFAVTKKVESFDFNNDFKLSSAKFNLKGKDYIKSDEWNPEICSASSKFKIYRSEAKLLNDDFIRIDLIGSHFYYHQIRLMVGAAILSVNGLVPDYLIDHALSFPLLYKFPLAPAEGLILKGNGLMPVMNEQYYLSKDYIPFPSSEFKTLLNDDSHKESEKLYNENILPNVYELWNDQALEDRFFFESQQYINPNESVLGLWKKLDHIYNNSWQELKKESADSRFIAYNRRQEAIKNLKDNEDDIKMRIQNYETLLKVDLRKLLPIDFYDNFCIATNLLPSEFVSKICSQISYLIEIGQLPLGSFDEIFAAITKNYNKKEKQLYNSLPTYLNFWYNLTIKRYGSEKILFERIENNLKKDKKILKENDLELAIDNDNKKIINKNYLKNKNNNSNNNSNNNDQIALKPRKKYINTDLSSNSNDRNNFERHISNRK